MASSGQSGRRTAGRKITRGRVLQSFGGPFPPMKTSFGYGVGLTLVALMLVLLLSVYLLVIGAAAWLTWRHLTGNVELLSKGVVGWGFYLMLAAVGVASVFFLIKPLFHREEEDESQHELFPQEQPLLFQFCARLAEVVGAPRPTRIFVSLSPNAGAALGRGVSGLLGKQLWLHIGLPLVRVFTLRQLAGVLAHEMGHFSQRWGMRLGWMIRRTCHWLLRVAYERDDWDRRLERLSSFHDWGILALPAWAARAYVTATRWILRFLAWIGVGVAGFFMRQMEYQADLYEAQLVGSRWFVQTMKHLWQVQMSYQQAVDFLWLSHHDGRLVDDFPHMVQRLTQRFHKEKPNAYEEWLPEQRLGWMDTHPTDPQRIQAVQQAALPGLFHDEQVAGLPARVLFDQFESLCRQLTEQAYRRTLKQGFRRQSLCSVEELLHQHAVEQEYDEAYRRYCQGAVPGYWLMLFPLQLDHQLLPEQLVPEKLVPILEGYREVIQRNRLFFDQGVKLMQQSFHEQAWADVLPCLVIHSQGKTRLTMLQRAAEAARDAQEHAREAHSLTEPWYHALQQRLQAVLSWVRQHDKLFPEQENVRQLLVLAELLQRLMASQAEHVGELAPRCGQLFLLSELIGEAETDEALTVFAQRFEELAAEVEQTLQSWLQSLAELDYPLDEGQAVTIGQWLTLDVEVEADAPYGFRIHQQVEAALDRYMLLLQRLFSRTCRLAQLAEQQLGLPPLPEPPEEKK